jgi:hypothetical protein
MLPAMATRLAQLKMGRMKLQLAGTRVRWFKFDSITFQEVMRLLPEGTSLARFREMCGLAESKMIFPFDLLDESLELLSRKNLPRHARHWKSRLRGGEAPPQAQVDEANKFFKDMNFETVADYLKFYLRQDVLMLAKGFERLSDTYFELFHLDIVDSRKFTISSLAATASQTHLFRTKAPGMFSPQDRRLYAILRQGLRGGLTAVYRTAAGMDLDFSSLVDLHRRQKKHETGNDDELDDVSDESIEEFLRGLNSHLPDVKDPGPADFLSYWDVTGLYSSAGQ